MRHLLATAVLLAATLCGTTAAHADIKWNGPILQGIQFNGISLQGISFNGISLQGLLFNGVTLQGKLFNGTSLSGNVNVATPDVAFTSVPLDRVQVVLPAR